MIQMTPIQKTANGMDIAQKGERARYFEVRTELKFMRRHHTVLAQQESVLQLQKNMIFLHFWLLNSSLFYRTMLLSRYLKEKDLYLRQKNFVFDLYSKEIIFCLKGRRSIELPEIALLKRFVIVIYLFTYFLHRFRFVAVFQLLQPICWTDPGFLLLLAM